MVRRIGEHSGTGKSLEQRHEQEQISIVVCRSLWRFLVSDVECTSIDTFVRRQ